ncbi:hypothetical protein BCR33DRAFT_739721 [Rhizoclosmatium globosum]|uniref:Uncharacterized protein n=1 Tax=Rhizoclosmatium globosum TaxID=329046 RepID=A0A1Y2C3X4_9FUNG|nr:hypothetical protein BCR33DRAFT_739721 [Rhizoclosmatium globosum]|eukprot:ORY41740.1 hypothetical protein BCR33DRAFT_739721 [Rhizoclosmatium globosum]
MKFENQSTGTQLRSERGIHVKIENIKLIMAPILKRTIKDVRNGDSVRPCKMLISRLEDLKNATVHASKQIPIRNEFNGTVIIWRSVRGSGGGSNDWQSVPLDIGGFIRKSLVRLHKDKANPRSYNFVRILFDVSHAGFLIQRFKKILFQVLKVAKRLYNASTGNSYDSFA